MDYYGWVATNRDLSEVFVRGNSSGLILKLLIAPGCVGLIQIG